MAALAKCVPNSTFQSSFDAEVKGYVLLCRNYEYRSRDAQALDPKYDDLAMIISTQTSRRQLSSLACSALRGKSATCPTAGRMRFAVPIDEALKIRDQ